MAAAKNKLSRDESIALIPLDAVRVKVKTAKGHEKYRAVDPQTGVFDAVLASDEIILLSGKPITMNKVPGRKKATPVPKPPQATTPKNAKTQADKIAFLDHDRAGAECGGRAQNRS